MSENNLMVDNLFEKLTDSERIILFEKIIKDEMLPEKLRYPDNTFATHIFQIFMTCNKSSHNWIPLNEIMRILINNNITEDESSVIRYVISKYITTLSSLTN